MTDYTEFLREKIKLAKPAGFEVSPEEINPMLKPHQRDIVQWALRGGRRAIFASFGLGKTFMQCEIMRLVHKHTGGKTLIVCPLGVRQEFKRDGFKLGIDFAFVRRTEEVERSSASHFLTNYESVREGKLDVTKFDAVSLDEASVLRSFGSKTYQTFLPLFESVPYRFVATATPAPNRYKELIHYAGYLGIMDTGQALTRFFQRDSTKANNLTLYPHKEREFYLWLHSWAVFLNKPSELGYSDEGYDLPELKVIYHPVSAAASELVDRDGQHRLFCDAALGLSEAAKEKRRSMMARVAKMKAIIDADPDSHYIIWHDLEDERRMIERALPEAVSVYGSQDLEERERSVIAFSDGEIQYLATKPELSGSGCNFQRYCHKAIFLVEAEYRDGNSGSKPKKKSKKSIARASMKRLRGYLKASYDELAILDYLSRGMSYPKIARETRTSRDDVARKVIDICNKVKAPSIEALKNGYIEWVEG